MTVDTLDLDPRTEEEARAAVAAMEAERERLGHALLRCRSAGSMRRIAARRRILGAARVGIVERFGFGMLMR